MEGTIVDLLSFCAAADFGGVSLIPEEEVFRRELNREMLSFCGELPRSTRTEATLFLMRHLRASFGDGLGFVDYFYAPAWSILFWLGRSSATKTDRRQMKAAMAGHTMALLLHALDDHLADRDLPVTHLTLLLRSQSWTVMNRSLRRLARETKGGTGIVAGFVDDYYSSIGRHDETSLDGYCNLFRKQMATCLIAPVLLSMTGPGVGPGGALARSVEGICSSFGVAWRLLDDIQDLEKDMRKGVRSAIYACLPDETRKEWDRVKDEKDDGYEGCAGRVLGRIAADRVIDGLRRRICAELDSAASEAGSCDMAGFGDELRSLSRPLGIGGDRP